jgi:hypothetical protein
MKNLLRFLLGMNAASIIRGCRFGPKAFWRSAYDALAAVQPMQDRSQKAGRDLLLAIPQRSLAAILDGRQPEIKLLSQPHEDGIMATQELIAVLSLLVAERPQEVLEIGTFMGHTTERMAANLPKAMIHTIDLPLDYSPSIDPNSGLKDDFHLIARRKVGREFVGTETGKRIVQHLGDTRAMDFKSLGHPTFFFIDGSHTYEYCKQDSEKCLEACGGAGTFLWHDCDEVHPDVVKFLLEWRSLGRDVVRIKGTFIAYWKAESELPRQV